MSVTCRRHDAAALVVLCNFSKFLPTSFRLTALEMSRWGCSETPPEVGTPPCQKTVRVDLRSLETVYRQRLVSHPCSADHERDWPPCKVVFFELATNALNVRNNNNNNHFLASALKFTLILHNDHAFHGLLDGDLKMPKELNNLFWLLVYPK